MNYLIISDVHFAEEMLEKVLSLYKESLGGVIFTGDGLELVKKQIAQPLLYCVKGNMDSSFEPAVKELFLENLRIFITHGHLYEVKKGLRALKNKISLLNCQLAIFGHTHSPYYEKYGEIVLFNPGALQKGEYGLLFIEKDDFYLTHEIL